MKKIFIILIALTTLASCSKETSEPGTLNNYSGDSYDGPSGHGGSLARFTIAMNHLYVVDDFKLYTYSLSNSVNPQLTSTVQLGGDIETIYSYKDKLFIGSRNAMFIYSISDPASPQSLGSASHVRACDPVVANDSIAYVTVRNGSSCGSSISALIVYNVKNVLSPQQITSVTMESPYGLGANKNRLYVCNGTNGMNIYDITKGSQPLLKKKITDDTYYDVIALENVLVCMVKDGMVLYDYNNTDELVKMAKITN
jgi:hypothetical protein